MDKVLISDLRSCRVNWRKGMVIIVLSCMVAVTGCRADSMETATEIVIKEERITPTDQPTAVPAATETATVMPTATETPLPVTDTPVPEPTWLRLDAVADLEGSTGPVYSLDWSPEGKVLASAGHSQVNLWQDGWEQTSLPGSFEAVAFLENEVLFL